ASRGHLDAAVHWAICTRATITYFPFAGLKIDASPSLISNQSFPNASRMFGLWVMTSVFVPRSLLAADQPRGPHGALEAAGVALPDRNPRGLEHLADRFGVGATRVVHLALFGDVV